MAVRLALALQDIAAARSGQSAALARTDPVAWAYVLRDAIALAGPELVVAHVDAALEADALAAAIASGEGDWVDRILDAPPLASSVPVRAAVELVATLAALPGLGGRVVASLSPPAVIAQHLEAPLAAHGYDADDDAEELADLLADTLTGLVTAYAQAGAAVIVVDAADTPALAPLVRSAAHAHVTLAVGPAALSPEAWAGDTLMLGAALTAAEAAAGPEGLVLAAVPGAVDPALLRAARLP